MTYENLIEGEIYKGENNNSSNVYIFKATKNAGYNCYIDINDKIWYDSNSEGFKWENYELSDASNDERRHFLACKEAGKYVDLPKSEIIESYEIF